MQNCQAAKMQSEQIYGDQVLPLLHSIALAYVLFIDKVMER
jgi:hypothetical protein